MSSITLSRNHNPKQQISFVPFKKQQQQKTIQVDQLIKVEDQSSKNSEENNQFTFYQKEINNLIYQNTIIMAQLSSALQQKKIIMKLISDAEKKQNGDIQLSKQKRVRRCAKDIQKNYVCPDKECGKSYATQSSLLQHIRLKHPKTNFNQPPLVLDPA